MTTATLNIVWLYPDILNLQGDRGNAFALIRVCRQLGVNATLTRVNRLADQVDLEQADMVLVGSGELAVMPAILKHLTSYSQDFENYVASGGGMVVTGTSAALAGSETRRLDGSRFSGLGLIGMEVREREAILGDDLIIGNGAMELGGFQIRMTDTYLGEGVTPLGPVIYGLGNNPSQTTVEGARRNNLVVTNLLGPALVKNPWFTAQLIGEVLKTRHPGIKLAQPDESVWHLERQGAAAVRRFVATKKVLPGTIRDLGDR